MQSHLASLPKPARLVPHWAPPAILLADLPGNLTAFDDGTTVKAANVAMSPRRTVPLGTDPTRNEFSWKTGELVYRYQMLPGNVTRLCQSRSMLTVVKSPPLALCIESCLWYLRFGKTCSNAGRFQLPCVGKSYKNDATFIYIESCFVLFRCLSTSPFDQPEKSGRSSQPLAIPRARLSLPHLHQSLTSLANVNGKQQLETT